MLWRNGSLGGGFGTRRGANCPKSFAYTIQRLHVIDVHQSSYRTPRKQILNHLPSVCVPLGSRLSGAR